MFMKLMSIVVKPSKVEAVKSAISSVGVSGATILDARGFGSTKGHTDSYRELNIKWIQILKLCCRSHVRTRVLMTL